MKINSGTIALAAAIGLFSMQGTALAADCSGSPGAGTPCDSDNNVCTDDVCDAGTTCLHTNTCTEKTGAGKNGGYFRVIWPADWDGDLVVVNHGFDLDDKKIRPHHTCSNDAHQACSNDGACGAGNYCNDISFLGLDQVLLAKGKAVAASTYAKSGWAVFSSAKDIKDMLKFVKKDEDFGKQLERVIVTGFSLGGAVTADATLKLKIDGAVPLCGAVAGGLTTWDVAMDVRMIYDFLCDDVAYSGISGRFAREPDLGVKQTEMTQTSMALTVDACLGVIGISPHNAGMDQRLADFLELTGFSGYSGPSAGVNVATIMGFATLGLGDFVWDEDRLKGKRIGLNSDPELDYAVLGDNAPLAVSLDDNIKRLEKGPGRKTLSKASNPIFTKGKGKSVDYPILSMAGAADWLVIPEFERVYDTALTTGGKAVTQTWIDTFGHCVFSEQEVTAVFNEYFDWLGPLDGPNGTQPTKQDVEATCLALPGGVQGDTCNFNNTFDPGHIADRVPARIDWPLAATTTAP